MMCDIKATVESLNICGRKLSCIHCSYKEHRIDESCKDRLFMDCATAIYGDGAAELETVARMINDRKEAK